MRTYDLTPVYRSTVGFDRLFSALDQFAAESPAGYPPYDIERTGENDYRITLAVAGFTPDDLALETRDGVLSVRGERRAEAGAERRFLHQGIAARTFERRFRLAEHVTVAGARLENGLLHVELVREVPEAARPRRIEIAASGPKAAEAAGAPALAQAA